MAGAAFFFGTKRMTDRGTPRLGNGWKVAYALAGFITAGIGSAAIGHYQYQEAGARIDKNAEEINAVKLESARRSQMLGELNRNTEKLAEHVEKLSAEVNKMSQEFTKELSRLREELAAQRGARQ